MQPASAADGADRAALGFFRRSTIRVRLTGNNDGLNATSFFFDSLVLTATYCQ